MSALVGIGVFFSFCAFAFLLIHGEELIALLKRGEPTCRDTYCDAFRWSACTGGRCKYHCDLYCQCAPVGREGWKPNVMNGGRKP